MFDLRRREFITLVGGAAVWPLADAQQGTLPVVGYLSGRSAETDVPMLAGLRKGLAERGYVEGGNLRVEYRFADGQYARLPALAVDLVERKVAVMVTAGGLVPAESARAATMTIPVVFNIADDPVRFGLVETLKRPGRNITGVTSFQTVVMEKQIGLLSELLPRPTTIALLGDSQMREVEFQLENARTAATALGHRPMIVRASDDSTLDAAFTDIRQGNADALLVAASPFFMTRLKQLIEQTARLALPAIYWRREVVEAGGLMMYGSNTFEMYHQAGVYSGRILKGENTGELPVWQPTKFEFILNLKTAKALRLQIPDKMLALADEVIE